MGSVCVLIRVEGDAAHVCALGALMSAHAVRTHVLLTIMGEAHPCPPPTPAPIPDLGPVLARIEPARGTPIEEAIRVFQQELTIQGRDPMHIRRTVACVRGCALTYSWVTPADITPTHIRAHMSARTHMGAGPKTRNTERGYLSRFCRFCVAQGWLLASPVDAVGKARVVRRRARIVPTEEQVRALIAATRKERRTGDRWLVYLTAATTGLRWGTLKALRWEHVRIDQHPPRLEIPGEMLKGRAPGTVFLPEETAATLRAHRGRKVRTGKVFAKVPKWDGFERDRKRAGLEKGAKGGPTLSFHSLRHFASNRMRWAGGLHRRRAGGAEHTRVVEHDDGHLHGPRA